MNSPGILRSVTDHRPGGDSRLRDTWGIYAQLLPNGFINYDDTGYITENPSVTRGVSWSGIIWAFSTFEQGNWHPLTWISHMLDCQLYGLNPAGHHLTNALFHAANTVLVFFLLRRMTGTIWPSAFVAALFGWHPLHVESVAWASERKDVLCAFFWLLTLLAYVSYVKKPRPTRYCVALVLFACSLMSKPMAVTLPFVLLLVDFWPLNRFKRLTVGHPSAESAYPNADSTCTSPCPRPRPQVVAPRNISWPLKNPRSFCFAWWIVGSLLSKQKNIRGRTLR